MKDRLHRNVMKKYTSNSYCFFDSVYVFSLACPEAQILFTKRAEPVEGEEFGESTLETEISLETGEVQWMRQSVVIQTGVHYTLSQSGRKRRLTVHNLGLSDRGTYRCETLHDRTQVKLNVEREFFNQARPWLFSGEFRLKITLFLWVYKWVQVYTITVESWEIELQWGN